MKIYCHGARSYGTQIGRIEAGFVSLGHELTEHISKADLIYSNDSSEGRDEIIKYKKIGYIKSGTKIIFNVLDIPEWNFPRFEIEKMFHELKYADKVTSISKFVNLQIEKYFKFKPHVIYNPIKDINISEREQGIKKYPFKAMMVGRLRDPSKRSELARETFRICGYEDGDVAIIGSEPVGWGTYFGVISDEMLNSLYNSVDHIVMTSIGEGLGLPALEGLVAGAVPVVCHDLTTFNEFYPPEFGNYPNPYVIANFIKSKRFLPGSDYIRKLGDEVKLKLSGIQIARNILEVAK